MAIQSFADHRTIAVFRGKFVKGIAPALARQARRRLVELNVATSLGDLRARGGNRLEALQGDRAGQWSIRVNDQWRICFTWHEGSPHGVELTDYH
jgi:toxin HigB-1